MAEGGWKLCHCVACSCHRDVDESMHWDIGSGLHGGKRGVILMRSRIFFLLLLGLTAAVAVAQARKTLDIYVIDVEGGNAVLFVTPSGESMLIDSGNGGTGAVRDTERI